MISFKKCIIVILFGGIAFGAYLLFNGESSDAEEALHRIIPDFKGDVIRSVKVGGGRESSYLYVVNVRDDGDVGSIVDYGFNVVHDKNRRDKMIKRFVDLGEEEILEYNIEQVVCYSGVVKDVNGWIGSMILVKNKIFIIVDRY